MAVSAGSSASRTSWTSRRRTSIRVLHVLSPLLSVSRKEVCWSIGLERSVTVASSSYPQLGDGDGGGGQLRARTELSGEERAGYRGAGENLRDCCCGILGMVAVPVVSRGHHLS